MNPTPKALTGLLIPVKGSKESKPDDFRRTKERAIQILEFLENIHGTHARRAQDTLTISLDVYLRKQIGGHRRLMLNGSIIRNWETARELGLFDGKGKFTNRIRFGEEKGKLASFEYIVPTKVDAAFSTEISNLRIVTPSEKRNEKTPFPAADRMYQEQLNLIRYEVLHGRDDHLGRTHTQNMALWRAGIERAGGEGILSKEPNIRVTGSITATPSQKSGYRWRVSYEVKNISRHPTEIKADFFVFGIIGPAINNKPVLLAREAKPLKLRSSEAQQFEVWTVKKPGNVRMRGWAIRVMHRGEEIEWLASQPIIHEYLDLLGSIPKASATPTKKRRGGSSR